LKLKKCDIAVVYDGGQHESSQSKREYPVSDWGKRSWWEIGQETYGLLAILLAVVHDGDLGVWLYVDYDGVDSAWPAKEDEVSS